MRTNTMRGQQERTVNEGRLVTIGTGRLHHVGGVDGTQVDANEHLHTLAHFSITSTIVLRQKVIL